MAQRPTTHFRALPAMALLSVCLLGRAAQSQGTAAAEAPNDGMRYVTTALQRDARDNQVAQALLSLRWGQRAWWQLGGGTSRSVQADAARRPVLLSTGVGYIGDGWQASMHAAHRRDGNAFRQTDWTMALDWQGTFFGAGFDGAWRDARVQGSVATSHAQGGTAPVPVTQSLKGGGIGLHGSARVSDEFSVFAGLMRYHYKTTTRQSGDVSGGHGSNDGGISGALLGNPALLGRTLQARDSAVTRSEAALSRSAQVGATYRWSRVALSGEYLADRVMDAPGAVGTVQLKAAVEVAPGWTLAPGVGRTRSDARGGVNFGSLTARFAW